MAVWSVEHGTFWAVDASNERGNVLPARQFARKTLAGVVGFGEIGGGVDDVEALSTAIRLPSPQPFQQRLADHRRCFIAKVGGQIAAYGWVTQGAEYVGEMERYYKARSGRNEARNENRHESGE